MEPCIHIGTICSYQVKRTVFQPYFCVCYFFILYKFELYMTASYIINSIFWKGTVPKDWWTKHVTKYRPINVKIRLTSTKGNSIKHQRELEHWMHILLSSTMNLHMKLTCPLKKYFFDNVNRISTPRPIIMHGLHKRP